MISVIVPVYKVEKYLHQCVSSILNQTYSDFELILVDDGSPDSCPEMCDRFAKEDPRIKVIHKQNGGLSDARNCGIDCATGEYITFVDSDDLILPDMLQNLLDLCVQNAADIACCGNIRCEDSDTISTVHIPVHLSPSISVHSSDKMEFFIRVGGIGVVAWSKLYEQSLFKSIRYPVGKYHEDEFTTYKLIHEAHTIAVTDQIGYLYRKNPESITLTFSPKRLDSIEGTLRCAQFMELEYPDLVPSAYSKVIWACNQCSVEMAKADYHDQKAEHEMQQLYRKRGRYYLRTTPSFSKKAYVLLAELNLKIAMWAAKNFLSI